MSKSFQRNSVLLAQVSPDKKKSTNSTDEKIRIPRKRQSALNTTKITMNSNNITKILNGEMKTSLFNNKSKTTEVFHTEEQYTIFPNLNQTIEISYKEDKNEIYKEEMEDKGKCILNFKENPKNILITLFDGHGGDYVSKYLQQNFDKYFKKNLKNLTEEEINKSYIKTFSEIDNDIKEKAIEIGSTGTILLITEEDNQKIIYGANVGDTRCTLFNEKNFERLSFDHRADDKKEKGRIINSGGYLKGGRVNGSLMLSRVFGDFEFKKLGVKCEPFLFKKVISNDIKNQVIILASDGIWDIIEEWEIKDYINDIVKDLEGSGESITMKICNKLIGDTMLSGGWDNISVFAIKLN